MILEYFNPKGREKQNITQKGWGCLDKTICPYWRKKEIKKKKRIGLKLIRSSGKWKTIGQVGFNSFS